MTNPFYEDYKNEFQVPNFKSIKIDHYLPAFEEGIRAHEKEIINISNNDKNPSFENTIAELEKSGELLTKVTAVFYNLLSADTNDDLDKLSEKIGPKLSAHRDSLFLNEKIFKRLKSIKTNEYSSLSSEQQRLTDEMIRNFEMNGANLSEQSKERFIEINKKLTELSIKFDQNVLKDTNNSELYINDEKELGGLSDKIKDQAKRLAKNKGYSSGWVFNPTRISMYPFLTSSTNRDLREQLYKMYVNRGKNPNEFNNEEIVREMANLRLEKAQLMGFTNHAELSLQKTMAKSSNGVNALLNQVWEPAKAMAQEEIKDMQDLIQEEGNNFALQAWDWMHYSEKVRKRKYDFDSAEVQPYLEMDAIRDSAFELASRLFGIKFIQKNDIPKYHPDVDTFEVLDKNGDHLGVFLTDYFARPSKQGGAWMNTFRDQSNFDGRVRPIVLNVCNFAKPNDGEKAFLTFEHAETLFHEFGHALHGLLSDVDYPYLSGTSVTRDYVEFPSQLMENWIRHSDFLAEFAKHFETGKPIPKRLLEKMSSAGTFNQGFATTEYMVASMLDLAWHTIETPVENTEEFEQTLFKEIGKPVEIDSRYGSTYFGHIFAGGYAAGYYSYMWSEVLDSHAFEIFDKEGLYDSEYAEKLKDFVYSSGNSVDLMNQYKKFRGEEPNVSSLLRKRGLN